MVKMLRFVSLIAVVVPFAAPTFGQTFEVKARNGSVVLTIRTIKMFELSEKEVLPSFRGVVENVAGESLIVGTLKGTVNKKDRSTVEFTVAFCDVRWCDFPKDSVRDVSHLFPEGSFTPATFDSVTFAVPWESESQRIADEAQAKKDAAQAQAKKDAADLSRRKRLAAEQKKKDAELNARIAKDRAEEDAKAADERRKLRAACTVIYQNTIDKKVKDLTVREEQQVRACQVSGLYPQ